MNRIVGIGLLLFAALGCKRSVEGETRAWERNTAKIRELKLLYPGFEPALNERMRAAEELYNAARQAPEEKTRADRMAAANTHLMSGFVTTLDRIVGVLKRTRQKAVDAAGKGTDEGSRYALKVAVEDAQRAVERVESTLRQGAKDVAAAEAVVSRALSDLETAERSLDRAIANATPRSKTPENTSVPTEKPPPSWKCEFCGNANDAVKRECRSCGAPKGK